MRTQRVRGDVPTVGLADARHANLDDGMMMTMKRMMTALALVGAVLAAPRTAVAQAQRNIVETAVAAGQFTTLAKALGAAGLIETLSGKGPFTVFAPTDAAFAKLPKATLDAILADKKKLTEILTYHVVPGKVMAADVVKVTEAKTVQGAPIMVKVSGGTVMLNGSAKVVTTDIGASNGVIHVIDTVILPPAGHSGH
jgi:uncharacterized surface protein with fasciclin (FAS1) repeats